MRRIAEDFGQHRTVVEMTLFTRNGNRRHKIDERREVAAWVVLTEKTSRSPRAVAAFVDESCRPLHVTMTDSSGGEARPGRIDKLHHLRKPVIAEGVEFVRVAVLLLTGHGGDAAILRHETYGVLVDGVAQLAEFVNVTADEAGHTGNRRHGG